MNENKLGNAKIKKCKSCKSMPDMCLVKSINKYPKNMYFEYFDFKCKCSRLLSPETNTTFDEVVILWNKGFRNACI